AGGERVARPLAEGPRQGRRPEAEGRPRRADEEGGGRGHEDPGGRDAAEAALRDRPGVATTRASGRAVRGGPPEFPPVVTAIADGPLFRPTRRVSRRRRRR